MQQAAPPVSPANLLVLQTRACTPVSKSHVDVTLQSGAVVRLRTDDVSDARLGFLRTVLAEAASVGVASASAGDTSGDTVEPTDNADAVSVIRASCTKDWPDDFRMRAYCQQQQDEGLAALRQRTMSTGDYRTIRAKCASDWPQDFRMRNYCEEQQLAALKALR